MFDLRCSLDGISFSEIEKQRALLQKYHIGPGDRVAVNQLPPYVMISFFLACMKEGATFCPLSKHIPPNLVESYLDTIDAKLYVDNTFTLRTPLYPPLKSGLLLFTSGSTATPKLAFLSLEKLIANATSAAAALSLSENDTYLLNLPLYHVAGIGVVLRSFLTGAKIVTDPTNEEITHVSLVSTQVHRSTPNYPKLKSLLIGGGPIFSYPEHQNCFFSYGLTEMGSLTAIGKPNQPYFQVKGKEIKLDATGEIFVRGDSLFDGYWNEGKLNLPLTDGWFATNDLGEKKDDGFIITGRKDFQFVSGGENIQPEEIERKLLEIDGIVEALVVPKKDEEYGRRPVALLVGIPIPPEKIRDQLLEKLPKFKIPIDYYFIDKIPKIGHKPDRKKAFTICSIL